MEQITSRINFYGEEKCESIVKSTNKSCSNLAYYKSDEKLLCGVHSRKDTKREELPKKPNKVKYDYSSIGIW